MRKIIEIVKELRDCVNAGYTVVFADGSKIRLNVNEIDNSVNYAEVVK